ncbi:MAG: NAD(P)/FAD-dependent oxidoreductase [Actinomycetota bacterium]
MERFVIAGASMAGGTAAATLREEGFDGEVVLVGDEPLPPYERPPLSKEYLRGEKPVEGTFVRPAPFWEDNRITLRLGERVTRVEPRDRVVVTDGGERITYDALLVATGSRNRRLRVPGVELEGAHDLRTIADADRIRAEVAPGGHAVVVGMGFIGSEVTATLVQLGMEVSVVEIFAAPLVRALGEEVGRMVEPIHRDHGVEMRFDDQVEAFEGAGRVERVRTKRGVSLVCDLAVVGIGVEPVVDFLAGSGVQVDDGIVVDERCRTNVDGIFAAGDVTRHLHPLAGRHIRVEHWQNALKQGEAAARSMLGSAAPYDELHWFWSDFYDHSLQYAGFHGPWDRLVVRGGEPGAGFVAFYLEHGRLVGVAGVDRAREVRAAMRMIRAGTPVDAGKLADDGVDLRELARSA